jgi:hypothetical protein
MPTLQQRQRSTPPMSFVCLYRPKGECVECGGRADPERADDFCSDDCAASFADNLARIEASEKARRDDEDAFAAEVARLVKAGYTYEEIDTILEGMP